MGVLFRAVNCIVCHYQSSAASFIQRSAGHDEQMSKHSWGRPGNAHRNPTLMSRLFVYQRLNFTCHRRVQTLKVLGLAACSLRLGYDMSLGSTPHGRAWNFEWMLKHLPCFTLSPRSSSKRRLFPQFSAHTLTDWLACWLTHSPENMRQFSRKELNGTHKSNSYTSMTYSKSPQLQG